MKYRPTEILSPIPPWDDIKQFIIPSSTINDDQTFQLYLDTYWRGFETVYTDGSRITSSGESCVACAQYYSGGRVLTCWKLNGNHSIITAELFAIYKTLESLDGTHRKVIIFSDSKSGLQLIMKKSPNTNENLVHKIQSLLKIKNQNCKTFL